MLWGGLPRNNDRFSHCRCCSMPARANLPRACGSLCAASLFPIIHRHICKIMMIWLHWRTVLALRHYVRAFAGDLYKAHICGRLRADCRRRKRVFIRSTHDDRAKSAINQQIGVVSCSGLPVLKIVIRQKALACVRGWQPIWVPPRRS